MKGKTLPLSAIARPDERPRPGAEVIVASGDAVAAGRMLEGNAGVRIRDIAPRGIRFSGLRATLDDAVSANREALEALENIAVHEPNLLGLAAGANVVYAETGANPRDTKPDTEAGRGLDVSACRRMLYEAGFATLRRGDGSRIPLDLDYVAGEACQGKEA